MGNKPCLVKLVSGRFLPNFQGVDRPLELTSPSLR